MSFWLFVLSVALGVWLLNVSNTLTQVRDQLRSALVRLGRLEMGHEPAPAAAAPAPSASRAIVQDAEVFADPAADLVPVDRVAIDPVMLAPYRAPEPQRAGPAPPHDPEPPVRTALPRRPTIDLADILAEKGLAWLGGAALVIGGAFLVGYAAQKGLFTPVVRLVCAVIIAGAMLGFSEWLRRRGGPRYALSSALLAGAGSAVLYATVWAAHALYGYIGGGLAAPLLLAVSLLLLGLSAVHGEALAILAVFGAFLAPHLSGRGDWSEGALTLHVLAVTAAGFVTAIRRRWSWTALVALAGALAISGVDWWIYDFIPRLTVTALSVLGFSFAFAARAASRDATRIAFALKAEPKGASPAAFVLPIALFVAPLTLTVAWPNAATAPSAVLAAAAALALCAFAMRRGLTIALALAGPAVALILAAANLTAIAVYGSGQHPVWLPLAEVMGCGAMLIAAGLFGAPGSDAPEASAIGSGSGLLLALIATAVIPPGWQVWLPAGALAVMGALAALVAVRRAADPAKDAGVGMWTVSALLGALVATHLGIQTWAAPAAFAALALAAAFLQRTLRWRGLTASVLIAGAAAAASVLRSDFLSDALTGPAAAGVGVAICATTALLLMLGGRTLQPVGDGRTAKESLHAGALVVAMAGVFLGLRWLASAPDVGLTLLAEFSLRTLTMALGGAALLLLWRGTKGPIATYGPQILIALALAHGVAFQIVLFNPWWGLESAPVEAIPLANSLALAFLAPAAVFTLIASRLYRREAGAPRGARTAPAHAAGAGVFGLFWMVLETRRAFHPDALTEGAAPYAEWLVYALVLMVWPAILAFAGRRVREAEADMARVSTVLAWSSLVTAGLIAVLVANPWWGLNAAPVAGAGLAVMAAGLLAMLTGMSVIRARQAGLDRRNLREGSLITAMALGLTGVVLMIRWAFHGEALQDWNVLRLETWTYSAVLCLAGAVLLTLGGVIHERTVRWAGLGLVFFIGLKVLLVDMASLDGVIRAGSFLAVGALMVGAAVLARRLGSSDEGSA